MVFEHISGLLKNAERFSILLIERAVVGLLRVCLILAGKVCPIFHVYFEIAPHVQIAAITTGPDLPIDRSAAEFTCERHECCCGTARSWSRSSGQGPQQHHEVCCIPGVSRIQLIFSL